MEKFMLVVVEKYEFEIVDGIIDNIFGIFGFSRMGSKEKTDALTAQCKQFTKKQVNQSLGALCILQNPKPSKSVQIKEIFTFPDKIYRKNFRLK